MSYASMGELITKTTETTLGVKVTTEQWQRHAGVTIGEIDRQRAFNKDRVAGLEVDPVAGTVRRPPSFLPFSRLNCPCIFERVGF